MYNKRIIWKGEIKRRKSQEKLIIMECKVMMNKLGDIPFDLAHEKLQKELLSIGNKYGVTGAEVFKIFMDNFSKERDSK